MAIKKIATHLDLMGNELKNFTIQGLSQPPSNPQARQIFFDTTQNSLFIYMDAVTGWVNLSKDYTGSSKIDVDSDGTISHKTTQQGSGVASTTASYDNNGISFDVEIAETDSYGHINKIVTKTITLSKPAIADVIGLQTALNGKVGKLNYPNVAYATDMNKNTVAVTLDCGYAEAGEGAIVERTTEGHIRLPLEREGVWDWDTTDGFYASSTEYVRRKANELNSRIDGITAFGRYLTDWDPTASKPNNKYYIEAGSANIATFPMLSTNDQNEIYEIKTGDYFLVSKDTEVTLDKNGNPTTTIVGNNRMPGNFLTNYWMPRVNEFPTVNSTIIFKAGGKFRFDGSAWVYTAPDHHYDLQSFTNTNLGGIKGSNQDGHIEKGDVLGTGKVVGWANVLKNNDSRLGNAAWKNVGNGQNQVAAGDHEHTYDSITNKPALNMELINLTFTKDNNSSDLIAVVEKHRTKPIIFDNNMNEVDCLIVLDDYMDGDDMYWTIKVNGTNGTPTGWKALCVRSKRH